MPIAYVQEFDATGDRSTTNYDAVNAKLNVDANRPEGLIVHTAGFTAEGVFRIFDVWESEEHWARFRDERLMPIVGEVMGAAGGPPPHESTYELHDVVRG